jgi:hypothetical protein
MSTIGCDDGGGRLQSVYPNSADFARLRSFSIIPLPEPEPCQPSCSQPQHSLLLSQTTPIRPSFSKITLALCKLKSPQSVHWLTRHSMPCTSLPPLPLPNIALLSLRSYLQQGCLPARIKPCAHSRLVRSIRFSFYPRQCFVGDTRRQSCRVEAEHPHAQRVALYYRSWLTASPSAGGQRTSHRRAIGRPG